ncbi:3-mercaptopyruvate sulfurtransferase [Platysternon megacephalum]|uniref:3-mercaptopyruvate sulfurtransferase n=1 Tax=Platysternon megacephalum TaxID=55544 RepID=A0A4D9EKG4_9SAUR|nr:3-mercaptopyruvate sulfurtransferase [Platysternon megacephalum]
MPGGRAHLPSPPRRIRFPSSSSIPLHLPSAASAPFPIGHRAGGEAAAAAAAPSPAWQLHRTALSLGRLKGQSLKGADNGTGDASPTLARGLPSSTPSLGQLQRGGGERGRAV